MSRAQPGRSDEVDPSDVVTATQLAALLRRCRLRAGNPGLREIERLGRRRGHALPRSTVAGVLAGRRRPRRDLMLALLDVFGVPDAYIGSWASAWERAAAGQSDETASDSDSLSEATSVGNIWRFPENEPVMITCGQISSTMPSHVSAMDPRDPDYVELLKYADPDALVHLFGHIRALNPAHEVKYSTTDDMQPADYSSHLVVVGGTDFNLLTRDIFSTLQLPVNMPLRSPEAEWLGFEAVDGDEIHRFSPVLDDSYGTRILHEDVILFFRGVNPVDRRRTITICAGLYARGTLAAAQCLTDPLVGPVNQAYLRMKVAENRHFGFIARAFVINGMVAPPDLTIPGHCLYEWTRPE
ncbi:helix-turn-helix domain-containing protein [Amycolatopsis sp. H6(2020)]|nr:helix-turn-helix domain-containing protein [Amycolatopsis sp. H6(2020)]